VSKAKKRTRVERSPVEAEEGIELPAPEQEKAPEVASAEATSSQKSALAEASEDASAEPVMKDRRRFLAAMGGLGLAWCAGAMYPVYKFLAPKAAEPLFDEEGKAVVEKITPADVAQPGMGKNGGYGSRGVIVYRDASGNLRAFDSKCTHAGCNVAFKTTEFYCACHGGVYDLNGKNVSGPPPEPLPELRAFERDGILYVSPMGEEGRS
jgi:Rieske Fe-S protein